MRQSGKADMHPSGETRQYFVNPPITVTDYSGAERTLNYWDNGTEPGAENYLNQAWNAGYELVSLTDSRADGMRYVFRRRHMSQAPERRHGAALARMKLVQQEMADAIQVITGMPTSVWDGVFEAAAAEAGAAFTETRGEADA